MLVFMPIKSASLLFERKKLVSIISLFLLMSCSSLPEKQSKSISVLDSFEVERVRINEIFPKDSIIIHFVEFKGLNHFEQVQLIFKNTEQLQVTGVSPFGPVLFTAEVKEGFFTKFDKNVPFDETVVEKILADMILVFDNSDYLLSKINPDTEIKEKKNNRSFLVKGDKLLEINYSESQKWSSDIEYLNYKVGYKVKIKLIKNEYIHK